MLLHQPTKHNSVRVWSVPSATQMCSLYTHMLVEEVFVDPAANRIIAWCRFMDTMRLLIMELAAGADLHNG